MHKNVKGKDLENNIWIDGIVVSIWKKMQCRRESYQLDLLLFIANFFSHKLDKNALSSFDSIQLRIS